MPEDKRKPYLTEPGDRPVTNCTIFLGYTSNLISSGIRDTLRYLVQHNMVRPKGFPGDGAGSLVPITSDGAGSLVPITSDGAGSLVPITSDGAGSLVPITSDGAVCVYTCVWFIYTLMSGWLANLDGFYSTSAYKSSCNRMVLEGPVGSTCSPEYIPESSVFFITDIPVVVFWKLSI